MADPVFVEQDPEPDIADPVHSNQYPRTHTHNHRHPLEGHTQNQDHTKNQLDTAPHARAEPPTPDDPALARVRADAPGSTDASPDLLTSPAVRTQPIPEFGTPSSTHTIEHYEKDGLLGPLHVGDEVHPHAHAHLGHQRHGSAREHHSKYATPESVLGLQVPGAGGNPEPKTGATGLTRRGSEIHHDHDAGEDAHAHASAQEQEAPLVFPEITWKASLINTIKKSPIVCALPLVIPVAWALELSHQGDVAVFVSNLLAIIPLAGAISFATEEIALRIGEVYGGLLNATFGNAVELLIAIIALVNGQIDIVQASMIGSVLSNLLLVLGCSYFAGGLRFHEQMYAIPNAQMQIGLLGITLLAVALPSGYHWAYPNTVSVDTIPTGSAPTGQELDDLLKMSRGISFILLACYGMFLMFQLYTHAYLFRVPREKMRHPLPGPIPTSTSVFPKPHWVSSLGDTSSTSSRDTGTLRRFRRWSVRSRQDPEEIDLEQQTQPAPSPVTVRPPHSPHLMTIDPPAPGARTPAEAEAAISQLRPRFREPALTTAAVRRLEAESDIDGLSSQQPSTKLLYACVMLTVVTVLAGVTAEFLVGSIDGLTSTAGISREFVGLILLPVIGNSVEHITAVTVSVKDKLNLSMSIAIGSSIQVSLCILPVLVLIAWPLGQPLTLYFDAFETVTLVVAVLLVNFAISDGRTNYLEGFTMMMAYVCIALVCWFYDPIR